MKQIIDLERVLPGYRGYATGSLKRHSIIYDGDYYILKYPERNRQKTHEFQVSSYVNNSFSEHVGSRIFGSVGISAQKTLLGKIGDEVVVACKDFINREFEELQEFSTIAKEQYSSSEVGHYPSVEKIYEIIDGSKLLSPIAYKAKQNYWEIQIVDALISNFDRHTGNWGYVIKHAENGVTASVAPVYDCGSSLWPKIDDAHIGVLLSSAGDIRELTENLPKGKLRFTDDGSRLSYKEAFMTCGLPEFLSALSYVTPKISFDKIGHIIDNTPYMSDARSRLFKTMLKERYDKIIAPAYEHHLEPGKDENEAREKAPLSEQQTP